MKFSYHDMATNFALYLHVIMNLTFYSEHKLCCLTSYAAVISDHVYIL